MTARPFAEYYPAQPPRPIQEDPPGEQSIDGAYKEAAVAVLLRRGVLSHTFGQHGDYEVRTTQTTRQPWQYRCCVLHRGKAIKRAFVPIIIDRRRDMPDVRQARGVNETMRLNWATEAVDVHLTRCSVLQEYLLLAAVNLQMPMKSRRYHALLILLLGVTFLVAYGVWRGVWTNNARPPENLPVAIRQVRDPGADRQPTGQPLDATPPVLSGAMSDAIPTEPVHAPQITPHTQSPKTVRLSDLLVKKASLQRDDPTSHTPAASDLSGAGASDVQAGDLLRLTGWIHRISRDPERAYRLHVRPSREVGSPDLIAVVPHPDQASDSPAMRAQLQTVRTFITQRLLRQQEPSPRGSALRRPIFLQVTGQLISLQAPQGKKPRGITTHWEVHPVLELQFAAQPESSGRSRQE